MTRRPVCLVCLLLLSLMCLADRLGLPLIRGNPLPEPVQRLIREQPQALVCGEAEQYVKNERSASLFLKDASLICRSKKYPIKHVKVFLKKEEEEISPGTFLVLEGRLEPVPEIRNPGEFDSRQYYASLHVYYFLKKGEVKERSSASFALRRLLFRARERLGRALDEAAGEEAPIFRAIVLGDKGGLEQETRLLYQMGGILHILAISGLHISLLGAGLYGLLKEVGLGLYPAGFLALGVMLLYGMMTGGSMSVMRAVCMFILYIGARLAGRTYDRPIALSLAALVILSESPALLYTSGFLLSFGCVLGLLCFLPAVERLLGAASAAGKGAAASLAVFFFTLPITLYFYGEASLAGLFLNLLVLPTVGIVLASGVAAALLGCLSGGLGMAAALPGRALLWGYGYLCGLAGRIPGSVWVGGQPRLWQIFLYYSLLALLAAAGPWGIKRRFFSVKKRRLLLGSLLGAGILLLCPIRDPCLRITCLDVGQGDGIVLESPQGYRYLVDGGSSGRSGVGQYQILPFLKASGISRLDGILVSHTDEDHISGVKELLALMEQDLTALRVKCLYLPEISQPPKEFLELKGLAERAGAAVRLVKEGDCLMAGNMGLSVLWPEAGARGEEVNENAMVLRLDYGDFSGLFTGDIGEETEKRLLEKGLLKPVDFLKTAHHGSAYSTSGAFLEVIKPKEAVISCSLVNTYGHPSPATVSRLQAAGCRVDYTMYSGAVTIRTDGKSWRVEPFLPG